MTVMLTSSLRQRIFSEIMGACNRLGQPKVIAHNKALYGGSGYARDLTDQQLVEVLCWTHDQLLSRVPTQKEERDYVNA